MIDDHHSQSAERRNATRFPRGPLPCMHLYIAMRGSKAGYTSNKHATSSSITCQECLANTCTWHERFKLTNNVLHTYLGEAVHEGLCWGHQGTHVGHALLHKHLVELPCVWVILRRFHHAFCVCVCVCV